MFLEVQSATWSQILCLLEYIAYGAHVCNNIFICQGTPGKGPHPSSGLRDRSAISMLRDSALKNATGAMNRCVASIHGANGKKAMATLKGILSGPHGDSSWSIIRMNHPSSWWIIITHIDGLSWIIMMNHRVALKLFLSGLSWPCLPWAPWHKCHASIAFCQAKTLNLELQQLWHHHKNKISAHPHLATADAWGDHKRLCVPDSGAQHYLPAIKDLFNSPLGGWSGAYKKIYRMSVICVPPYMALGRV